MNLIAAADVGNFVWLLLVLACPLMMVFMMRGMHGGHSQGGNGHAGHGCHGGGTDETTSGSRATMSLDELKRERDELNALIGERAADAVEAKR